MASPSPSGSRIRRFLRAGATVVATSVITVTAGCGFDVQTNQPYTPGEGPNANVGTRQDGEIAVRNLFLVSAEPGTAYLSASLLADRDDTLVAVGGQAYGSDGLAASALTSSLPGPVALPAGTLVVLTDEPRITLTAPELRAGLEAEVRLAFAGAGELSLRVPVVTASDPSLATLTPVPADSPAPSGSPEASESPDPSESPTG